MAHYVVLATVATTGPGDPRPLLDEALDHVRGYLNAAHPEATVVLESRDASEAQSDVGVDPASTLGTWLAS